MIQHVGKKNHKHLLYSQTSPQRPPWGQKKEAVVERLPLAAVRLYFAMFFFSSPKEQFAALSSVLSFSVIQSFLTIRILNLQGL